MFNLDFNNLFFWYKAWNSPYINHFLQPDTIIPDQANPQTWNRYAYVMNRPVNFNDPTGHMMVGNNDMSKSCIIKAGCSVNDRRNKAKYEKEHPKTDNPKKPKPDEKSDKLTEVELVGQVITISLIETFLLMPLDFALVDLTLDGVAACGVGVALACVGDIPLGAVDVIAADFQISLFKTVANNVATGTKHEFEWTIIPRLLSKNKKGVDN